mmetsp:Transcript_130228/g.324704  ORF Transcript_130228/g.324704 Transcript_130228/m.324704 type:complete len:247 (+) Transcript_130228:466-1206(+)
MLPPTLLMLPAAGRMFSSWPESPLPSGVGTEADVSARVDWSEATSRRLWSEVISAQYSGPRSPLGVVPSDTDALLPYGLGIIDGGKCCCCMPGTICSIMLVSCRSSGSSLMVCAKRQLVPCLQRPLAAKRQSLVLKKPAVVRSSRSSCAKVQPGLSQLPVCRNDLHMLVLFKSGFSRISVRLCANAQREPLPHLFDKKNLHISVFISCRTCFSRSEALGNSSDAIADRGRWGQQVSRSPRRRQGKQ